MTSYTSIDMKATGQNIKRLRKENGYTVRDLQRIFGFKDPQTIYRWQWGQSLPNIDNLVLLSKIFEVSMERILVITDQNPFPHKWKK